MDRLEETAKSTSRHWEQAITGLAVETATDYRDYFRANFQKVDLDDDGFLTVGEIDAFKSKAEPGSRDDKMAAHLKEKESQIEELYNDEWGDENDGISARDLLQWEVVGSTKLPEHQQLLARHVEAFAEHFDALDADSNGYISSSEAAAAPESVTGNPGGAALVDFIRRGYHTLPYINVGDRNAHLGVSKSDMQEAAVVLDYDRSRSAQLWRNAGMMGMGGFAGGAFGFLGVSSLTAEYAVQAGFYVVPISRLSGPALAGIAAAGAIAGAAAFYALEASGANSSARIRPDLRALLESTSDKRQEPH